MTSQLKIAIAAGGTGGHIYPALALGEKLRSDFNCDVDFLCGERELELGIYAAAGEKPIVFPARQIGGGITSKLTGGLSAFANVYRAMRLCSKNDYQAVIGMGGYVAGPAVLGAFLSRRATAIHESNAIPGRTNRILAPLVTLTAVHFPGTSKYMKMRRGVVVGMPIRDAVLHGDKVEALRTLNLQSNVPVLLIIGGSQGAKKLYDTVLAALPLLDAKLSTPWQILWSTGKNNRDSIVAALRDMEFGQLDVVVLPYIERMDLALAAADVALARAGSSSMAELLSNKIPAVYVPFPAAIYDHQTVNAQAAVSAGAGELLPEANLTAEILAEKLDYLCSQQVRPLIDLPTGLDSSGAAARLAAEIVGLVRI